MMNIFGKLTDPDVRTIFCMKLFIDKVILSLQHNPHVPEFGDLSDEWARIIVERMEGRNAV